MLTVLLQVRYHREEGKCRAGAHGPASEGVRAVAAATAAAATRGTRGGGTNVRRGYERSPGDGTNENERERASMRGGQGGLNEHMRYERSTGDGTNEHKVSAGSTNERRRVRTSAGGVRTSTRGARGIERTSTGGTNIAGAAAGAARPSSLVPLLLLLPLSNLI